MAHSLKVLIVEDSINDCDLIVENLRENGYEAAFDRVESEPGMLDALKKTEFDVILCDHSLPDFDVYSAYEIAKKQVPQIPFIVVSGTVSESIAVKTLKAGAKDYILKNNLSRLAPSIERELLEVKTHRVHLGVEAELKTKELELRQSQKLEAVGQLAGGVAHDFNNILAVILMQCESSLETLDENLQLRNTVGPIYKSLEQIKKAGERAANLTRQLLAFSRKQLIQPQVLAVNDLTRDMQKMLSRIIEENISLVLELDEQCKNIKVDPGHFEQIIMNLVVNSRDAMPHGGKITIKTGSSGSYTLLEVADTGSGMSEEVQAHIFDPFFTTKDVGKGTGLGLSTVYGIVKQNNGKIDVESRENVGTTFSVYFPQCDERSKTSTVQTTKLSALRGTETILVAEDEADLRELVCTTLRNSGYTVLEASDGIEALELIKAHKERIHLVLTDVVMPIMGGQELSQKAKEIDFKSMFLFLSGYTEDMLLQHGINSGQSHFLEKPYTVKVLLNKVRSILESKNLK